MSSNHENSPLPYGWIKEIHHESGHPYYVDTKATPPRSIWVHPYDDDQYLREHPDVREKVHPPRYNSSLGVPIDDRHSRRHSYNGRGSSSHASSSSSVSSEKHPKRGLMGKLKDKAIGTKEGRQAEKRHNEELRAQQEQQRMAYMQQNQYTMPYGQPQRMGGMGMGGMGGMGRRGGGMGGMALPLVGGMAGGLLLGDMLDGGFNDNNYGGGFDGGGGDFGDGDFGGGF